MSIQPLGCGSSSWTALAPWWSFTAVGSVEFPLTDWEQAVLSGSSGCIVLATQLKTSPPKSALSVMSHNMLQRRDLVWEHLLLVCKGPKKLVHIDSNLLLKGVWGYLIPPKPTAYLLCISCIWCRRPQRAGSGALPSTYGCLSVPSFQHTCCKHMSHLSQHFHHSPCQRAGTPRRKREDSQLKLHHKSFGSGRNGE